MVDASIWAADNYALNAQGAKIHKEWLGNRAARYTSTFLDEGYVAFDIPADIALDLKGFFADEVKTTFRVDDHLPSFWNTHIPADAVDKMNAANVFFGRPSDQAVAALERFLTDRATFIENELASKFRVVNVRAWTTLPGESIGPTNWHHDGGSWFLRKIMIYPQPINTASGTFEAFTRRGVKHTLDSPRPTAVLTDSAILFHRGVPGTTTPRPSIEVTLDTARETSTKAVFAGHNARIPKQPRPDMDADIVDLREACLKAVPDTVPVASTIVRAPLRRRIANRLRRLTSVKAIQQAFWRRVRRLAGARGPAVETVPDNPLVPRLNGTVVNKVSLLNIGGGARFNHPGWLNLDAVDTSEVHAASLFDPDYVLPVAARSVGLVYSSHTLEHLNDATVSRLLDEARRVLRIDGHLLIKLPDFDATLKAWEKSDASFFDADNIWGFAGLQSMWNEQGVANSVTNKAAFVCCGYWNRIYGGDHFRSRAVERNGAYFGPPIMPESEIDAILRSGDPHRISAELVARAAEAKDFLGFNHQNGWSRTQFVSALERAGFSLVTTDFASIRKEFGWVPTIDQLRPISAYYLARPAAT